MIGNSMAVGESILKYSLVAVFIVLLGIAGLAFVSLGAELSYWGEHDPGKLLLAAAVFAGSAVGALLVWRLLTRRFG